MLRVVWLYVHESSVLLICLNLSVCDGLMSSAYYAIHGAATQSASAVFKGQTTCGNADPWSLKLAAVIREKQTDGWKIYFGDSAYIPTHPPNGERIKHPCLHAAPLPQLLLALKEESQMISTADRSSIPQVTLQEINHTWERRILVLPRQRHEATETEWMPCLLTC